MGDFWNSWQLWEKMVFVLAVGIVLTMIAGAGKLLYDHQKIRKFSKIESQKLVEQATVEEIRPRRGRHDVPFGVRAIESGVEVEGVWISRNNSPASSAPPSPSRSPNRSMDKGKTAMRSSDIPSLLMPEPAHPYPESRSRSATGSTGSFERAVSAERLHSGNSSPEAHPVPEPRTPRPSYKPRQPSALRYSTADDLEAAANGHINQYSTSSSGSSEEVEVPQVPEHYQPKRNSRPISQVARSRTPIDMLPFTQQSRSQPGSRASLHNSGFEEEALSHTSPFGYGSTPSVSEAFETPNETPTNFSFVRYEPSHTRNQSKPLLENIELVEKDGRKSMSSDESKRQSRKLQKKKPSI